MSTLIGAVIIIAIVILIIKSLHKDRKEGKHICGGNCGSCGGCNHDCK